MELDLHFMKSVLPILDKFEKIYQSQTVMIHKMYADVRSLFKQVLVLFLKKEFVDDNINHLKTIDFTSRDSMLKDDDLFIGEEAKIRLSKVSELKRQQFLIRVKDFYKTLSRILQKYLPLSDPLLRAMQFIRPQYDGNEEFVCRVAKCLGWGPEERDALAGEWRLYQIDASLKIKKAEESCNVIDFWTSLSTEKYPNLSKIALSVSAIPCGNASVERVFSDLSDLLTKKRSRLSEVSIDSCLLINGFLKQTDHTCITYPVEESMINAGFNAHASYMKRLKEIQKQDEEKAKELACKRKINEQIDSEIKEQKRRNKIFQKDQQLATKKAKLEENLKATDVLLKEYKKRMDLLTLDMQEVKKEETKIAEKKEKAEKKIINSAITTALAKAARENV